MSGINTILRTSDQALVVNGNPLPAQDLYDAVTSGAKTVASAGTAEALVGASSPARLVMITTNAANTGRIAFGDSNTVASTDGGSLGANETVVLPVPGQDLANLYIDATVNGEGVKFTVFS